MLPPVFSLDLQLVSSVGQWIGTGVAIVISSLYRAVDKRIDALEAKQNKLEKNLEVHMATMNGMSQIITKELDRQTAVQDKLLQKIDMLLEHRHAETAGLATASMQALSLLEQAKRSAIEVVEAARKAGVS